MNPGKPFIPGDVCLLIDNKGRRYLIDLGSGETFHYHGGMVGHDEVIGRAEGSVIKSSSGTKLRAYRPRLADYILAMKRGAQVVYPKDIGPILMYGDVGPGMTVLEAGTGSGALTMALVRAVGAEGRVVSVERREDHGRHARRTIERFFGGLPQNLDLRSGEVEDHVADVRPDRIVLDIPEPWSVVEPAAVHLQPGGVFVAYLPTVPQVQQLREVMRGSRAFPERTTFEVLIREWAVEGRSVRPEHQMVGHTGFVTVARKAEPPAAED